MNYSELSLKQFIEKNAADAFSFSDLCECGALASALAVKQVEGMPVGVVKKLCPHCCDEQERNGIVRRIG